MTPATSKGFDAIAFAEDPVGMRLIPWQRWLLIHALELRPDGRFRFRFVLVLVARQNGKTSLVEVKNLWKMFVLRVPLVLGTAQNLDIAEESWDNGVAIVEAVPELAAEIAHIDKTNGKKALKLIGGQRWKIAAASRRGGRGLSGDDVNLDELREHQTWDSWGAVSKTTLAKRNPQIWAFTNAGDDKSIVLIELQGKARKAAENPESDPTTGLFEWSAPDDVRCTCGRPEQVHAPSCRLQDRTAWAAANPSMGYTITEEAIASALATDPTPIFQTEVLCQHVKTMAEDWHIIPEPEWRAAADVTSAPRGPYAVALEAALDRTEGCIAIAGRRKGKGPRLRHVEIAHMQAGLLWMVPWLVERKARLKICAVVVDSGGPAGSLIPALEEAGFEVLKPALRDLAAACGGMQDGIAGKVIDGQDPKLIRDIRHLDQGPLTAAVAGLSERTVAETTVWERAGGGFIAVAAAEALWGHAKKAPADYEALHNIW